MSKSLLSELQSELAKRRKKVERCEEALVSAQEDAAAYVAKISEALGIGRKKKPGPKPKVAAAPTAEEEPGEAAIPEPRISAAPSKREQVRLLYNEGKTIPQMAEALDTTHQAIYQHLHGLRKDGLIQPRVPQQPAEDTAEPSEAELEGGDGDGGSALDKLRGEVMRQQAGVRSKPVHLNTAITRSHVHRVIVDRMGDGSTQPDESKHVHRIYRFVMSQADGHSHGITIPDAA